MSVGANGASGIDVETSGIRMEFSGNSQETKMKELNDTVFIELFKEACAKCFGYPLTTALSETDSKLLSNKILEQTGLVIGVKSIKNYSLYVTGGSDSKKENPSVATLDTLARYVLDAPYTDEIRRKDTEGHHPYWFQYRSRFSQPVQKSGSAIPWQKIVGGMIILFVLLIIGFVAFQYKSPLTIADDFTDSFNSTQADSLSAKGWHIKAIDTAWWHKRDTTDGHLALYTLRGDNWSTEGEESEIKNLLWRSVNGECFSVEVHLSDFFPRENWQQAGILLAENEDFSGKVIRLSLSYNDFFGGYERSPEIIIQGMSSAESGVKSKPEEFAHVTLFNLDSGSVNLVRTNMSRTALKIERKNGQFRFLYSAGSMESFAFKEIITRNLTITPRYVALFATRGLSDNKGIGIAKFDSFVFASQLCGE